MHYKAPQLHYKSPKNFLDAPRHDQNVPRYDQVPTGDSFNDVYSLVAPQETNRESQYSIRKYKSFKPFVRALTFFHINIEQVDLVIRVKNLVILNI